MAKDSEISLRSLGLLGTIDIRRVDYALAKAFVLGASDDECGRLINAALSTQWASFYMRKLYRLRIFDNFIPEFRAMAATPQTKRGLDVLEHSFRVLNEVDKSGFSIPRPYQLAALFHDVAKPTVYRDDDGKITFYDHDIVGAAMFKDINKRLHLCQGEEEDIVCDIIHSHMHPLQYQREPNWSQQAIEKFMKRCNFHHHHVIMFAKFDKMASNKRKEYLAPLDELLRKCEEIYA